MIHLYPKSTSLSVDQFSVMYNNETRQFICFLFLVHDPAGSGLHVRVDHGPAGLRLSGAD
jgi:hypothetical protein